MPVRFSTREQFDGVTAALREANNDDSAPDTCAGKGGKHQYAVALIGHGEDGGSQRGFPGGMARYWHGLDDSRAEEARVVFGSVGRGDAGEEEKNKLALAFASRVHDEWGVGESACHNGILFFLSLADRRAFISTGSGKAPLSDLDIVRAVDAMTRVMKREGGSAAGAALEVGVTFFFFFFLLGGHSFH